MVICDFKERALGNHHNLDAGYCVLLSMLHHGGNSLCSHGRTAYFLRFVIAQSRRGHV